MVRKNLLAIAREIRRESEITLKKPKKSIDSAWERLKKYLESTWHSFLKMFMALSAVNGVRDYSVFTFELLCNLCVGI